MAGAFLYDNMILTAASVTAPAAVETAGVSNLLDPQVRLRMRSAGTTASVLVDLGSSRALDCVFVASTTVTGSGGVRVRLSTVDTTGAAGDGWDSGLLAASTDYKANGNIVVVRSAGTATGRYLLVEVFDGSLSVIDIGYLAAGALWRLPQSASYGEREGRIILDREDRNPLTGAAFPVAALNNPRFAAFSIGLLSSSDITGEHRTMLAQLGGAKPALWIPDISLTQAEMNQRSLWGGIAMPGQETAFEQYNIGAYRRDWRIVERV